ncbi:MAG: mannose-1-phosphate guanylyltransferase [Ignavibacteria bacterium]|jgi:mannose-1-phosphate guanylyltransferase
MDIYAVIMAGGVGSRFWPMSREKSPKQLLKIFGDNTMIQDTMLRLNGLINNKNIFVITNQTQKPLIQKQVPTIPKDNIIDEPFGKNTAACIGLASVLVEAQNKDAVIVTLPADHLIKDVENFQNTLTKAVEFAGTSDSLVTIGIEPTRPETGYGYIQVEEKTVSDSIHKVLTFAEKPNLSTAERFVESGDFLWNSGIFIWKAESILNEIKTYMPDLHDGLEELKPNVGKPYFKSVLTEVYGKLKSISIDYGVMEKSQNVYLTKSDFDWSDVGSWQTVYELSSKDDDGNAVEGDVYIMKTKNSYIKGNKKFVATIGVSNLIVIDTDDALLICDRKKSQDVKNIVDSLKLNSRKELL